MKVSIQYNYSDISADKCVATAVTTLNGAYHCEVARAATWEGAKEKVLAKLKAAIESNIPPNEEVEL